MTHGNRVERPVWAYVAALCLAVSGALASCYNGDQSCAEAYNPNDLGDHCPYGPPGGPKVGDFPDGCPKLTALDPADPACTGVTWATVHAMMIDPDRGNCVGNGCHQNNGIGGIDSLVADPQNPTDPADTGLAMLDSLSIFAGNYGTAYPNVVGANAVPRLYYDRDQPERSWWHCNLKGDAGSLMPRGKLRLGATDIELLETWLACGAPGDPAVP